MEADRIRLKMYFYVFTALLIIGSFGFMVLENPILQEHGDFTEDTLN